MIKTKEDISPKGWKAHCLFSLQSKVKAIQAIKTLFLLVSKKFINLGDLFQQTRIILPNVMKNILLTHSKGFMIISTYLASLIQGEVNSMLKCGFHHH
jgi:hypothetical protein